MREVTVGSWSFAVLPEAQLTVSEGETERFERRLGFGRMSVSRRLL